VIHAPQSLQNAPLLLVFHGGGGPLTSAQKVFKMEKLTGFDQLADQEHFVVVYPMANGPHWNDLRPEMPKTNDLEFIDNLVSDLEKSLPIDRSRVYATGHSNGAFFVNYLGLALSNKITAIASMCGPVPTVDRSLVPSRPISALLIDGTNDPKVPFMGGGINDGASGYTLSHQQSVTRWIDINGGIKSEVLKKSIPATTGGDPSQAMVWQTRNGALVGSVVISGGTHQWYNSRSSNFDATHFIWWFFSHCPPGQP
jgi:polyhydroxybutyrate depolymerase